MGWYARERAGEWIARLAAQSLDVVTFWRESSEALAAAVPHYLSPCWFTLDPASLLVTSHYQTELPELPAEWLAHEYYEDDFHKFADVAVGARVSTLHEATGGDPSRSPGWNLYVRPYGGDQEVLVALRTQAGEAWGMVGLYREPGEPRFGDDELAFLRDVSPYLAEGARRGLLVGEAADPDGPDAPGLLVLGEDWSVESLTPGVERWLSSLPGGDWDAGTLPPSVLAVAGRALRTATNGETPGDVAFSRVLSEDGRWIVLHGASLVADGVRRVADIVEAAHPARISPPLDGRVRPDRPRAGRHPSRPPGRLDGADRRSPPRLAAHGPATPEAHLREDGVRSRRELVGKVFFAHYEPRVRDNERRAGEGAPVRGGPFPHDAVA